jgi:hypothetical protein
MVDPSTAMFCALAEVKPTAPSTLLITWLSLTAWLELESFLLEAVVSTALVAVLSVTNVLWVADAFFVELELVVLALVSDDAL